MRLVLQLIARLALIVLLCLAAAAIWVTVDAYRSVDRATTASAERVSQALEALYWRELLLRSNRTRDHLLPVPDWRTTETMKLIAPGGRLRGCGSNVGDRLPAGWQRYSLRAGPLALLPLRSAHAGKPLGGVTVKSVFSGIEASPLFGSPKTTCCSQFQIVWMAKTPHN